MKEKTKLIQLRIPESSLKKLKEISKKECRTLASVVRQAIQEHLKADRLEKAKDAVASLDGKDYEKLKKHFMLK